MANKKKYLSEETMFISAVSLCESCDNTNLIDCDWFNPDVMKFPEGVKTIRKKNPQKGWSGKQEYLYKVISCPNFKPDRYGKETECTKS